MIDLRSDTATTPTPAMREAMLRAEVGDDVYGEDPTVAELERRAAQLLGHEAGLFCATGSLANLLGIWLLAKPGEEVLCDAQAHIVRAELGAHAALHGVTTRTFPSVDGVADPDVVASMLSIGTKPYIVETGVVALENTHNFGGGAIQPYESLRAISERCREAGITLHLDGARLVNAHVATGVPMPSYGRLFDTVSLCLSKGLGAPIGSVLVSTSDNIARARVQRKRLGGGWRQAGILAAAGLYALDHHLERLTDDHAAARAFAEAVAAHTGTLVEPATNIVVLDTGARTPGQVVSAAKDQGVAVSAVGPRLVRAVTHLGVSRDESREAGSVVGSLLV